MASNIWVDKIQWITSSASSENNTNKITSWLADQFLQKVVRKNLTYFVKMLEFVKLNIAFMIKRNRATFPKPNSDASSWLTGAYNEDSEKDEHGPHHFRRAHRHFRPCHAACFRYRPDAEWGAGNDLAVKLKTNFMALKILCNNLYYNGEWRVEIFWNFSSKCYFRAQICKRLRSPGIDSKESIRLTERSGPVR